MPDEPIVLLLPITLLPGVGGTLTVEDFRIHWNVEKLPTPAAENPVPPLKLCRD